MLKGLLFLVIVILIIISVFLAFQVNDNSNQCRLTLQSDQEKLTKASRMLLQSATQQHDLFGLEHAQEAKFIVDEIIYRHGGVNLAEKALKLPRGKLEELKAKIGKQFTDRQSAFMEKLVNIHPELDVSENADAGLDRRRRRSTKRKH